MTNKAQKLVDFITERYGAKVSKYLGNQERVEIVIPAAGAGFLALTNERILYQTQLHEFNQSPNQISLSDIKTSHYKASLMGGKKLIFNTKKGTFIIKVVNEELAKHILGQIS